MNLMDFIVFGYAALRIIPIVQQGYNGITLFTSGSAVLTEIIESELETYQSKNKTDQTSLSELNSIKLIMSPQKGY